MANSPLKVAWCSFFPVEWLADVPKEVSALPKGHPATWQQAMLAELEQRPDLKLHIIVLRKQFRRSLEFERNGVTFHLIKPPGGWRAPSLFWLDTVLIGRLLRQIQPALLHAWGTENGAALVAARLPYPYLVTVQGLMSWMAELMPVSRYQRLTAFLEKRGLRQAKVATAESSFAVGYLRHHYPHLQAHHVEQVPKPMFCQVQRRPQLSPFRFVFVGTVWYPKGADLLFGALDRLRNELDFELVVIGSGEAAFLQSQQARLAPECWRRIRFFPQLDSAGVMAELARATMMILPTRADTGPTALKEAVIAGVPVVAANIGGVPDYVVHDRNGVLCAPNDQNALEQTIREACRHPLFGSGAVDPETLALKRTQLDPARAAARLLAIYDQIVGTKPNRTRT
jgi:glycosyltransferase involved in cell wall biosynthesis